MTTPLDPFAGFSEPEPEPVPEPIPSVPRRWPRRVVFMAVLTLGALLIAGGAGALFREMTRKATPAEANTALQQEIATRWERIPAGKIFPATLSYSDPQGDTMSARLVGIAPPASCQAALEADGDAKVHGMGCATILRATYVDASGALAATVGVAILRSPSTASQVSTNLGELGSSDALHAVAFEGTIIGQFGDAARGAQGEEAGGPYVFLYTDGFTDGLPGAADAGQQDELTAFGSALDTDIQTVLTGHGKPCNMKDIKC